MQVIDRLKARFGKQKLPKLDGPWEMILWENVAYLANDERRNQAFEILKNRIGTEPTQIVSASDKALLEVTRHGIMPEQFADKLRKCAKIALEQFDGNLQSILIMPMPKAKKALMKFPGIGEPGAEKILVFSRNYPQLPLESNGLRVLLRLGFGEEKKNYATTYRLVQQSVLDEIGDDYTWLIQAHLLLRRHGQELCRRSEPLCDKCPLAGDCEYYRRDGN